MREPLGLSIGTTNFVVVHAGAPPVTRCSQLTLFAHRAPQIGSPHEHPDLIEAGLLIDGFVERMGEREPLIAADGSAHPPHLLLIDAIDAMIEAAGVPVAQLAIAVPAHWPRAAWQLLQEALLDDTDRSTVGAPPYLVSDAVAALAALQAERDLAPRGVVALLDFGGGGTNITLADAASGFRPIDETLRYREFSGNLIDQAILARILGSTGRGDDTDAGSTAAVGDLVALTGECRRAKERLSVQTAAEVFVDLPGYRTTLPLTRFELEQLIEDRLDGVVAALEGVLRRNGIDWRDLSAVATVGGGAHIPLITERLSARHQVTVVRSQRPAFAVAVGAAMCARRGTEGTEAAGATAMAPAATATTPAVRSAATTAGQVVTADKLSKATADNLAWSQEEVGGDEPAPFVGVPDDDLDVGRGVPFPSRQRSQRSYHLPQLALGLGALVAMIAVAGVAYTLTSTSRDKTPTPSTSSVTVPVAPPSSELPSSPPAAGPPAPRPSSPAPPPPVIATNTPPPPASTTTPEPATATTTTTTSPTTTSTSTTTTPTTTTPSTTPTTTTTTPSTTPTTTTPSPAGSTTPPLPTATTVPMTTEYLTIPFVPIPIPVQVPEN